MQQSPERSVHWAVHRFDPVPTVAIRVYLRGGSRVEPLAGLASLTGELLSEGTPRADWQQVAERCERRGMSLSTFGALAAHGLAINALACDWREALVLAAELVAESIFPADRLDLIRQQTLAELESINDHPDRFTGRRFLELLYGAHPAGREVLGTAEDLASVAPSDCLTFHQRARAAGVVVAISGAIEVAEVARAVEELFASTPQPLQHRLRTIDRQILRQSSRANAVSSPTLPARSISFSGSSRWQSMTRTFRRFCWLVSFWELGVV